MASSAAAAPSTRYQALQTAREWVRSAAAFVEHWLEAERDQLVLWLPVMLGAGVAGWLVLPGLPQWTALLTAAAALVLAGFALPLGARSSRVLLVGGIAVALGCGLVWWRAERVASPILARPAIVTLTAQVERVEPLAARELVRLRLRPLDARALPEHIRVNVAEADVPQELARGAVIQLRARLMPPPGPAVPGAYDYARVAWFDRIGATGRGFAPVKVVTPAQDGGRDLRQSLSAHIRQSLPDAPGAVAASLATGDQGAIPEEDAEAMRRSGLAHLLSVSGLHITAVVAATMVLILRLLALSPWAALHLRLPLIAAAAGAAAAIGYTWLTGAEVPTIRSCVAALLVLVALALGREAMTLRLVAAGAMVILLLWPEALAGASFQLSFAAVTAIVALHEGPVMRRWFGPHEEGGGARLLRGAGSLLLTGVVVEIALLPIGLFHFHKAGMYGALANMIAIPLTTFVIMPLEALALLLDVGGLGAPLWWLCGQALRLLLWVAHATANAPGAVQALPAMPRSAYALIIAGGLWIALWRTRVRWAGALPLALGAAWAMATPAPDVIVTGDGRHLAIRTTDGSFAVLRERAGDYVRSLLAESGGVDGELPVLDDVPAARCNSDLCFATVKGRRIAATRSFELVDVRELIRFCHSVDVMVSDRRLPRGCAPRWLKLDRPALARSGGVTITLVPARLRTVADERGHHPWIDPSTVTPDRTPR